MENYLNQLVFLFKEVSFERYVEYNVLKYPTLYARGSMEEVELSLLDQILNVNGNGLQTSRAAAQHYTEVLTEIASYSEAERQEVTLRVQELMNNEEDFIHGYTQAQLQDYDVCKANMIKYGMDVTPLEKTFEIRPSCKIAKATYERLKSQGKLPENIVYWYIREESAEDAKLREMIEDNPGLKEKPEVLAKLREILKNHYTKRKQESNAAPVFCPYPNFDKKHSALYGAADVYHAMVQSPDWQAAMLKFYERCQAYFDDASSRATYHYAYEPENHADQKRLQEFEQYVVKFASFEEASKALGHPYTGDPHEYLTQSWQRELSKIQSFIAETIERIKTGSEFQ